MSEQYWYSERSAAPVAALNWVEIGSLSPGDRVTTLGMKLSVIWCFTDPFNRSVVVCVHEDGAVTVLQGFRQRLVTRLPEDESDDALEEESVRLVPTAGESIEAFIIDGANDMLDSLAGPGHDACGVEGPA